MTDIMNGSPRLYRNGRGDRTECRCPLCSSVITPTLAKTIIGLQQEREMEIEQGIAARFELQIADAETRKKREIDAAVKAATKAVETKLKAIQASQSGVVAAAVEAERARSEKAVSDAVATAILEQAAERTRLELALADALRRLQAKSANQLGEPLEAALFDSVSEHFGSESGGVYPSARCKVSRVAKGRNGPDLVIEIFDPGTTSDKQTPIGVIAVEAKNVSNWSSKFVSKLKRDARALNAEPILVSNVYPRDSTRGLCVVDGVVVCAEPYLIPMIELMHRHLVEMYRQKLTGKARNQKGAALLQFCASGRCAELLGAFAAIQEKLRDTDQKEKLAHSTVWRRRGELIGSLQQAHSELVGAFDAILAGKTGTSNEVAI